LYKSFISTFGSVDGGIHLTIIKQIKAHKYLLIFKISRLLWFQQIMVEYLRFGIAKCAVWLVVVLKVR